MQNSNLPKPTHKVERNVEASLYLVKNIGTGKYEEGMFFQKIEDIKSMAKDRGFVLSNFIDVSNGTTEML